jgi:hypothetical protein
MKPTKRRVAVMIREVIENDPFLILACTLYEKGIREGDISVTEFGRVYHIPDWAIVRLSNFIRDIHRKGGS